MKKNLIFLQTLFVMFIASSCKKETTGLVNVTFNCTDAFYSKVITNPELSVTVNGKTEYATITSNHQKLGFTVEPGRYSVSVAFRTTNQYGGTDLQTQTKYGDISAGDKVDVSIDF